jgi:hypothetical protein
MLDTTGLQWGRWPSLLQRSAAGCLGVLLLALVYVVLAGPPQPIAPASSLFAPVSMDSVLADSRPALSSADFSLRPMFAIKRVPPPPQSLSNDVEEASTEVAPLDEMVDSIDGVRLLGIFGSGEVAGAIIRLDNGERKRVPVGEFVKGWALQSLEPRGALFEAATGQQALLTMAFSTDQSVEASPARAVPSMQRAVSEQPVGSSPNSSAAEAEAPQGFATFGDAYGRRVTLEESGEE